MAVPYPKNGRTVTLFHENNMAGEVFHFESADAEAEKKALGWVEHRAVLKKKQAPAPAQKPPVEDVPSPVVRKRGRPRGR